MVYVLISIDIMVWCKFPIRVYLGNWSLQLLWWSNFCLLNVLNSQGRLLSLDCSNYIYNVLIALRLFSALPLVSPLLHSFISHLLSFCIPFRFLSWIISVHNRHYRFWLILLILLLLYRRICFFHPILCRLSLSRRLWDLLLLLSWFGNDHIILVNSFGKLLLLLRRSNISNLFWSNGLKVRHQWLLIFTR